MRVRPIGRQRRPATRDEGNGNGLKPHRNGGRRLRRFVQQQVYPERPGQPAGPTSLDGGPLGIDPSLLTRSLLFCAPEQNPLGLTARECPKVDAQRQSARFGRAAPHHRVRPFPEPSAHPSDRATRPIPWHPDQAVRRRPPDPRTAPPPINPCRGSHLMWTTIIEQEKRGEVSVLCHRAAGEMEKWACRVTLREAARFAMTPDRGLRARQG
jgi:hypothetical protein